MLAFAPCLDPNGHETELGSAMNQRLAAPRGRAAVCSRSASASASRPASCSASPSSSSSAIRASLSGGSSVARAFEEVDRADHVTPIESATARRSEPGGGARRQRRAGSAELLVVPSRLLEVVAEHLVELDEVAPVLVEPGRVSLVELGPRRLRQRFVGGIPAQEVAEAERLLVREERVSGRMSSFARARSGGLSIRSRPGRALESLPDGTSGPRSRRTGGRSARRGRADPAGPRAAPESWAERRPRRRPTAAAAPTISSTNSGLPSAASWIRARSVLVQRCQALDQKLPSRQARAARAAPWWR